MTSHAADLLRVRHDDPHYQDLARAEAEFWAKPHPFGLESIERNPVDDPINLWMNARFTGDPRTPWEATVSRHGPFRRGLILIHDAIFKGGTVEEALKRIEAAGYGVVRLWAADGGVSEDDHLGLAVVENSAGATDLR